MTTKETLTGVTDVGSPPHPEIPPVGTAFKIGRWWNGRTRMILFVFGGLIVLGRSDTLDPIKLAYLAAVAAVVVSAAIVAWQERQTREFASIQPWIAISLAVGAVVGVSLPVALAHGVAVGPWLRGAASYGLFAAAPLVAFDARRIISAREAVGWMAAAGALAAISFSIYWLDHRHIVELVVNPPVLPSAQLADAGFAVAVAFSFRSRHTVPWAVAGGLVLGALLITGTRTTFLVLAVVPILAIVAGRSHWRQVGRAILVGGAATSLVIVLTIAALNQPGSSPIPTPSARATTSTEPTAEASPPQATLSGTPRPELIGERLGSVWTVLSGQGWQSLSERIAQTKVAFAAFAANPLLGSGPGRLYRWVDSSGLIVEVPNLDTPLMIAAEFGLLGVAIVLALIGVFAWFIRITGRATGLGPEHLSVVGLATTFGLTGLLGPPMDDKGAAYALALVLTIALTAPAQGRRRVEL
jgi:hypothetical protein